MTNYRVKNDVLDTHKKRTEEYKREYWEMRENHEKLIAVHNLSQQTIAEVLLLIESISNKPDLISISIKEIHKRSKRFYNTEYYERNLRKYVEWSATGKIIGAGVGGAFAAGMPKAANILISKGMLRGAAKGAGKVAARAAGPIGLGIAGVTYFATNQILEVVSEKELEKVRKENDKIKQEIVKCRQETEQFRESIRKKIALNAVLRKKLADAETLRNREYEILAENERVQLRSLITISRCLAKL